MKSINEVLVESDRWTSALGTTVQWTTCLHLCPLSLTAKQALLSESGDGAAASELSFISRRMEGIKQELREILVSWHRMDWMHGLVHNGEMPTDAFRVYIASDIDLFHIRMRSAFDYLATVALGASPDRTKLRKIRSFQELSTWIQKKPQNKQSLGEVADVIADTSDWFCGLRELRDLTIHNGGYSLPFAIEEVIGFMPLQPGTNPRIPASIVPDEVMYNDNVVDFRKYAVLHACWYLDLVEKIVGLLLTQWETKPIGGTQAFGGCVEKLREWATAFASNDLAGDSSTT